MNCHRFASTLALLATLFLAACGGGSGGGGVGVTPPQTTWYVDAASGADANPGTEASPLKTLTTAVLLAGPGTSIVVAPGTYDAANGEAFPITLQAGQQVIGDVANRGTGNTPTSIVGEAQHDADRYATVVMAEGARLAGFEVAGTGYVVSHHAIWIDGVTAEVDANTVVGPTYSGVWISGATSASIHDNDFHSVSYGVYTWFGAVEVSIDANTFHTPAFGLQVQAAMPTTVISNNTIYGSGLVGLSVWAGEPLIQGNHFERPAGYTYGAITTGSVNAAPRIRGNTFLVPQAIRIQMGTADLGTAMDPGNNDFSLVTGVSLWHEGPGQIDAIGNTWPNTPPLEFTDIDVTGAGSVAWGPGVTDVY